MASKTYTKKDSGYIYNVLDQLEWDDAADDGFIYTFDDMPEFESEAAKHQAGDKRIRPKTYLVIYSPDSGMDGPARGYYRAIQRGGYEANQGVDSVYCIKVNNVSEFNAVLSRYRNIYAIFIFVHSYCRSRGFTFKLREPNYKLKYNITCDDQGDGTPVYELTKPDMNKNGYIELFSCDAVEDGQYDIADALSRHFGVPVLASKSGVSLWPFLINTKTGVWTHPIALKVDDFKATGFVWTNRTKRKWKRNTHYMWP